MKLWRLFLLVVLTGCVCGVDIGGPQLAMHSIREMCCSSIIYQETQLIKVRGSELLFQLVNSVGLHCVGHQYKCVIRSIPGRHD